MTEILTLSEVDVLHDLVAGLSVGESAGKRFVSHHTIKSHRRSLYRKLGVCSAHGAIVEARRLGIVETPVVPEAVIVNGVRFVPEEALTCRS